MTKYLEMIDFVISGGEPLAAAILAIPLLLATAAIIIAAALVLIAIWVAVCMIYESYAKPTPKIRSLPLSPRFSSSSPPAGPRPARPAGARPARPAAAGR